MRKQGYYEVTVIDSARKPAPYDFDLTMRTVWYWENITKLSHLEKPANEVIKIMVTEPAIKPSDIEILKETNSLITPISRTAYLRKLEKQTAFTESFSHN